MRDKMSYNLLPIAQKNSKFFENFKLFDIGKVWTRNGESISSHLDTRYAEENINEQLVLGALWYKKGIENWSEDTILEAKSTVESIIKTLGVKGKVFFEKSDFNFFHPKKQAKILLRNGATPLEIGYLATLHPLVLKQNKFPETAQLSVMELNLEVLKSLTHQQSYEKDYETLQDQLLWRDLSFVLDAKEDFGKLLIALEKMNTIEEVRVFDLYQGENLGEGKKSISLQIKIKGDGNMTSESINAILQDAIKKGESTGAKLRA